jgi:hypothetical protein
VAGFKSISAAMASVEHLLNRCFDADADRFHKKPKATVARTNDFEKPGTQASVIVFPGLSIFVYRVDFNKAMRAAWSAVGSLDGRGHLPLDLHFLLTPWDDNGSYELEVLGKAMECLEATPILSGPLLHPAGEWAPNEAVQVVLEDLETEAVMRIWDSLTADFRLSVPYIGRVVRVDTAVAVSVPDVATVISGVVPSVVGP